MKASEASLMNLLGAQAQFAIPIYQRTYSWGEGECRQLWDDLIRAGRRDYIRSHFVGSVVYIDEDEHNITMQSPKLVIDGQQRLCPSLCFWQRLPTRLAAVCRSMGSRP